MSPTHKTGHLIGNRFGNRSSKLLCSLVLPALLLRQDHAIAATKQTEVKIQKTSMTKDQEIELGKQAAAQVEREMEVIHNADVEAWLNQIGQSLAKTPQANAYPFYFKLLNEESINAFALPGGPMYVHTGLIRAAENEDEVAGVLAHEMSHVALRHGAAQMSKQQTWGTLFGVIGAAVGVATAQNGQCGLLCQVGQGAAGLGGMALMTKFSRGYEKDADLNGARMMSSAGYNPMGLPTFFEKLEKQSGAVNKPSGLESFLSDHPQTGSRIQYVSDDIKFYPKKTYGASTGKFAAAKKAVESLPPPKPKPAVLLGAKKDPTPRTNLPQGFKDYQANGFEIGYPGTWQAGAAQGSSSIYMIPQGGAIQQQTGGLELIAGGMIDYYIPEAGAAATNLEKTTEEFLNGLKKGDPAMKAGQPGRADVGRKQALLTKLTTLTSQKTEQTVYLYTVARESGLWYLVLAAPSDKLGEFDPVFKEILGTIQFPN